MKRCGAPLVRPCHLAGTVVLLFITVSLWHNNGIQDSSFRFTMTDTGVAGQCMNQLSVDCVASMYSRTYMCLAVIQWPGQRWTLCPADKGINKLLQVTRWHLKLWAAVFCLCFDELRWKRWLEALTERLVSCWPYFIAVFLSISITFELRSVKVKTCPTLWSQKI